MSDNNPIDDLENLIRNEEIRNKMNEPGTRIISTEEFANIVRDTNIEDVSINLKRMGCHGFCPRYDLIINGSGLMEFAGLMWVSATGQHHGTIRQEEIIGILNYAVKIDFFGRGDSYNQKSKISINEHGILKPVEEENKGELTILTFKIGTYKKTVSFYDRFPEPIYELRNYIEDVAGVEHWITGD